jgi:hypothetical protein
VRCISPVMLLWMLTTGEVREGDPSKGIVLGKDNGPISSILGWGLMPGRDGCNTLGATIPSCA